jgi:hypothetical protein
VIFSRLTFIKKNRHKEPGLKISKAYNIHGCSGNQVKNLVFDEQLFGGS